MGKTRLEAFSDGIIATAWNSWIAIALYVLVAIMWFIPDRRIENSLRD